MLNYYEVTKCYLVILFFIFKIAFLNKSILIFVSYSATLKVLINSAVINVTKKKLMENGRLRDPVTFDILHLKIHVTFPLNYQCNIK